MTSGMQLVVYPTNDLAAAKTLFSTLLGGEPYVDQPYYVGFRTGRMEFGLDPNGHARGSGPVCYWDVADIEAATQALVGAGAELTEPAHDVGGGKLIATLKDADGNVIGLSQPA